MEALPADDSARRHNLALIGFRGAGKTTVARLLAGKLGWPLVDADAELVSRAGNTIAELFASEGEAGFRRREAQLLEELSARDRTVVATGGGVVLAEENRRRLRDMGGVIWLRADAETTRSRLESDSISRAQRPALTQFATLDEEIRELLSERSPLYREVADLVLDTQCASPEALADAIARWWHAGPGSAAQ